MWEISIISSSKNRHYLFNIKKNLSAKFKNSGLLCVCEKINDNHILSIACSSKIQEIQNYLKEVLAERIVLIFKEDFLNKMIIMENVSETCKSAFIKALMCFDFENDVNIVFDELNINSNINLEAFYKFRLGKLRNKWNDLINATSYDSMYLNNYEIFLEFLKFLIESIKPTFKEINVYFKDNYYVLLDENGKRIVCNEASKVYKDEISLVTDLIMLAPLKIKFYCGNVSRDTQKLISYIFDGRVQQLV